MLFFLFAIALRKAAVAVENIIAYQIAYFCIAGQTQVELSFGFLARYGKYCVGIVVDFFRDYFHDYYLARGTGKIYLDANTVVAFGLTGMIAFVLTFVIFGSLIHRYRKTKTAVNDLEATK